MVTFSIGKAHPDFGDLPLILASTVDGKALNGGWRCRAARRERTVQEVAKIKLR